MMLMLIGCFAHGLELPRQLEAADQVRLVELLGVASTNKLLDRPYSLGGFSGLEVSLSYEFIDLTEVNQLGCRPGASGCPNTGGSETSLSLPRVHVGKGLYQDVDIFFHFIPPFKQDRVFDYGGSLRWTFYEGKFLPFYSSVVVQGSEINFMDSFTSQNMSADLVMGANVEGVTLYFGMGYVLANARFVGGTGDSSLVKSTDPDLDSSRNTLKRRVEALHTLAGVSLQFQNLFFAAEFDRYIEPVLSTKVGWKF